MICTFVIFALFVPFVSSSAAQSAPSQPPRPPSAPRFDLSVGGGFLGGSGLGSADADLRGRSNQPYQLFATTSRLGASVPLEIRLDLLIGPRYVMELRGAWARPELSTTVSGDVENAPALTVVEQVDQYSLELGLLVNLARPGARAAVPFVSGGVGYVAAVHEGLTLLENGVSFRGGGGIKYPLATRNRGRIKGVGVRADAALIVLASGLATGSGATRQVTTTGSLYLTF